jgi:cell division protein FtsB
VRVPGARGVVAATTGMLGLSSTRRAAVLALVVCAMALTVAVPLRNYVAQRQELAAVSEQQRVLAVEVAELTRERARLSDPAEIEAQARSRLGYVMPGEVPYVVQLPAAPGPAPAAGADAGVPWYRVLWREVVEGPR